MRTTVCSLVGLLVAAMPARSDQTTNSWEWFNAAEFYQEPGPGHGADPGRVARYFRIAAEKGNPVAAFKLGELYEHGTGVSKDPVQAFTWYMRSAARNDKHGQLKVGWCYQKGIGVQADPAIAAIWYRVSADNDNIWAYHMLAFMLADGEGVKKDVALARRYLERSLPKTKDHWAKWKLAHLLAEEDPKRAKALMKEAAAAGNRQAAEEITKSP
ncbi:tetratricopeptide repeat protein [Neorhizobium sp. NPDC001467]|uniref:tetratricopeptide repeat protein n=1 Tax=Neorhizobium sp. NPDC001467 TaxID=3390595 RepID=UPI003D067454